MTTAGNTIKLKIQRPHVAQSLIVNCEARFIVVRCGRRFGKTKGIQIKRLKPILAGKRGAYFAPTYKMLKEFWREVKSLYKPIISHVSEQDHRLEFLTGGSYEMWSLDNPDAGRSRKYHFADIDEAGLVKNLEEAWNAGIRPTLTDFQGDAGFWGTPKGLNYFHTLDARGSDESFKDWKGFHFPTSANPFIAQTEIDAAQQELPQDVFRQEYLAEFIQGEGAVFRNITANLTKVPTTPNEHIGHKKVLGGDWGQVNDFTALSVLCVTCKRELELERFNKIDWEFQRKKALALMDKWDVETGMFEENSIGSPNLEAMQKSSERKIAGFLMTAQSKPPLIQSLALALEQTEYQFIDEPIATREMEAYEAKKNDHTGRISYNAPTGFHDDTVIGRAIALQAANVPVFEQGDTYETQTGFAF